MLTDSNAMATIAVRDMAVARKFYEDTLHLRPLNTEMTGVATYASGDSTIVIYESQYAGSNRATTVTWGLGDRLSAVVEALAAAGVNFEHYDLPGGRREGDIHVFGDFKAAWFKDPDGNILHINSA
ncbi:MAG: VOC family protein [Bacteroidota bacterium]